jgi:hypothetical protein
MKCAPGPGTDAVAIGRLRVPPVADSGWRLLQLVELLRRIGDHQDRMLTILWGLEPSIEPGFLLGLKGTHMEELHRRIDRLTDLAEQAAALIDNVPVESAEVTFDELTASARRELARGDVLDSRRVSLAASMLRFETGWPALAEGLRTSEVHASWEDATVGDVLSAFRGTTPQLVRRVATAAGLAPGAEIAECSPDAIVRLADQLDEHSGRA